MTPALRRWVFLVTGVGLVASYLQGLSGLPGFGNYPGPYGPAILSVVVAQTQATGVVSAGVSVVLRHLRGERARLAVNRALDEAAARDAPPTCSCGSS